MASESPCKLRMGREQYNGLARLDAEHIDFSGPTKFRFRFSEMRNPGRDAGLLAFDFHGHAVRMDIGERTEKWLEAILHPKTLSEKLGVRNGQTIRFVNFDDDVLRAQLGQKNVRLVGNDCKSPCDLIVFGAERAPELRQLESLGQTIADGGAIWVMLPKGSKNITQANIQAAARQANLQDGKPVSYSEAFTAYRVVVPIARRSAKMPATALRGSPSSHATAIKRRPARAR